MSPSSITSAGVFQPTPSARRVTGSGHSAGFSPTFQPTPSARRVTCRHPLADRHRQISTHTLRKEGDQPMISAVLRLTYFNPHPPQGG